MSDWLLIGANLALKLLLAAGALYAISAYLTSINERAGFSFSRWLAAGDEDGHHANSGYGIYLGLRWLGVCFLLGSILGCQAQASPLIPERYDREIRTASETWLPGLPWELWKAQLFQESRLRPDAVSPVGARGLAQFMPGTWREVAAALRYDASVSPHSIEPAILAGAYYMAQQRRAWRTVADFDRHRLAAAGYNAGLGNIRKASRRAGGATDWTSVAAALPDVTGRHALETQTYVTRIWRWFAILAV